MLEYKISDIRDYFDKAAKFSSSDRGVTRLFCSEEHKALLPVLRNWMEGAGLQVRLDALGNLRGFKKSKNKEAKTLIIGSHQDSVIEGGKYDGILGVLLPLYVLKRMHEQEIELNYHIELIAFGDEEGVRFPKTLLGSKSLCGDVCSADLEVVDKDGVTLKSALEFLGANTNEITKCAYDKDDVLGFFEVHIEQGPVLESESLPVGVVTAITGIERHRLFIQGKANHAGTTPMDMRQDALVTASHIICFANDLFCNTENLVGVVGELNVYPNAVNVIPDRVDLTVEIRSPDKKIRQEAAEKIYQYANKLASEQNTAINFNHNYEMDGIKCDEKLQSILGEAIEKNNRPVFHLFSGAGHDGLAMDRLTGVAMLFLRCKEGLSHHHEEDIDYHDAIIAAEVIETFLLELEEA